MKKYISLDDKKDKTTTTTTTTPATTDSGRSAMKSYGSFSQTTAPTPTVTPSSSSSLWKSIKSVFSNNNNAEQQRLTGNKPASNSTGLTKK